MAFACRTPTRVSGIVILLLTGCGGVRLYPVEGTVTYNDKPVADAGIMFHPKSGGPVGEAVTDTDGKFVIRCMNKPGLPAGEYNVTVIKQKTTGLAISPDGLSTAGTVKIEWLVPEKYSKIEGGPLTATVPAGNYQFTLTKS